MNFSSSKYYYDIYLYEKLLTEDQIEELKKLERDIPNLLFKLRTFICSKEVNDRYREYYKDTNARNNVFLKDVGLQESSFNTIKDEQKYHARLLHISNFISSKGLEKLNQLIDRGILRQLYHVFSEVSNYYSFQKNINSNRNKYERAVEKNVLNSLPSSDIIFDDFDMVPFYKHSKIFEIKNYVDENGSPNISKFLKDIIAFIPENEMFGDLSIEVKDDGRSIYYYIKRDLMITLEANGIPYSVRSGITSKNYDRNPTAEFNDTGRQWDFSQGVDIINKVYREVGSDHRLYIVSDLPKDFSRPINTNSKIAILVSKKMGDPLRQDGIGFLGFHSKNQIDPNQKFLDNDFSDYLDKMNDAGLFNLYSKEEIEHVRHLAKSNFLYAPVRMLWFFDYFVMAICPRENGDYKNFVELIPKLTHGKVLLENLQEDLEKGEFGFTLNGKSYFTNELLKQRVDPYFMLLINKAMQEQGLGAFYFWNNEFDPHEQFSVIYSNSAETIAKANASSYYQFMDLSTETLQHWRDY